MTRLVADDGPEWRGLYLEGGQLWCGRHRFVGTRPRLRFDVGGPTIVVGHRERSFAWDQRVAFIPNDVDTWFAWGFPGSRNQSQFIRFETPNDGREHLLQPKVSRELGPGWKFTYGLGRHLLRGIAWAEVPPLLHYLAETPDARAGLTDAARVERLVHALDAESRLRRKNVPPGEPMMGPKLDLYVAANRELDRIWNRRFGGRPVAGEWIPDPDDERLWKTVTATVPRWSRDKLEPNAVAEFLYRAASVHPWPFDVLLPEDP